jgi:T-complex protein 1 subunit alpha
MTRASQQMLKSIKNAKIACVDFNLSKFRLAVGISVECADIDKLSDIRKKE